MTCNYIGGERGSPPQVRGKRFLRRAALCKHRITPAGAGKTGFPHCPKQIAWDHPRRCGENLLEGLEREKQLGSPPQVRGKPIAVMISGSAPRITPAGAGKTSYSGGLPSQGGDHPRRCGENTICGYRRLPVPGSPPQVRGKPHHASANTYKRRITPAGAGKTSFFISPPYHN